MQWSICFGIKIQMWNYTAFAKKYIKRGTKVGSILHFRFLKNENGWQASSLYCLDMIFPLWGKYFSSGAFRANQLKKAKQPLMNGWKLFSLEHPGQALFSRGHISLVETRNSWGLDSWTVSQWAEKVLAIGLYKYIASLEARDHRGYTYPWKGGVPPWCPGAAPCP